MFANDGVQSVIEGIVILAAEWLIPFMVVGFVIGIFLRGLIYYTAKREEWFTRELDKRVDQFVATEVAHEPFSFYVVLKKLLEKTYYEVFEMRSYMKRRNPDFIMTITDRVFLVQQGVAWFVRDILKQVQFLPFNKDHNLLQVSKKTLSRNPCFNKVFGILPSATLNDLLNILPGIFIVLGIFGTFLGIMKALPDLGGMDLNDIEGTKQLMNQFLLKISFSMSTSLVGIMLSVTMNFLNASFSPEKAFVSSVDRLESSLETLWHLATSNDRPEDLKDFDQHKDPVEALAEQAVDRQLARMQKGGVKENRRIEKQAS